MKYAAVSQRVQYCEGRAETRDCLDQQITNFLGACKVIAVPVPNELTKHGTLHDWLKRIQPHLIVLSGGNNIGESAERDLTEYGLLDHAQSLRIPLLGICRGMQMIGVWSGASLEFVNNHVGTRHKVTGSISRSSVNSFHTQRIVNLPDSLSVLSEGEDGTIEAISHKSLPWEGWMWHPEREIPFHGSDIERLKKLL